MRIVLHCFAGNNLIKRSVGRSIFLALANDIDILARRNVDADVTAIVKEISNGAVDIERADFQDSCVTKETLKLCGNEPNEVALSLMCYFILPIKN